MKLPTIQGANIDVTKCIVIAILTFAAVKLHADGQGVQGIGAILGALVAAAGLMAGPTQTKTPTVATQTIETTIPVHEDKPHDQ